MKEIMICSFCLWCMESLTPLPLTSWILSILLVVSAGAFLFAYVKRNSTKGKHRSNDLRLPPGPPGLPILGNFHMLGDLPHHDLSKLAKKYGPIMYIRLGLVPTIVVSSPQAAELFLKTHDIVFASRPKTQAGEYLSYNFKGMASAEYGSYWRNIRKLCTIEVLSNIKIELFKPVRKEELGHFIRSLQNAAEGREVVNISAKVESVVEDIVFRMILGSRKEFKFKFKPVIQEALRLAGAFNLADYVPYIGSLDLQGLGRRMKKVGHKVDEFIKKVIDEHVKETKDGKRQGNKDFIDVMLSLMENSKDTQEEHEHNILDETNIKAIIFDMLAGSIDTTVTLIDWTLCELLRNPRVMKKLQEELENVVGMNQIFEERDLGKLDYLDMVVKESLRLHPIAPLLLPHESIEDVEINGYHIPKKSRVLINVWAIGHDPDVWSDNAEKFFPERFIGKNIDVRGRDFQLIPFGSGRRGCPGIQMGLTMVRIVLAHLVHCFHWELPDGMSPNDLDMSEKFGLGVSRANHLFALPTFRLNVTI